MKQFRIDGIFYYNNLEWGIFDKNTLNSFEIQNNILKRYWEWHRSYKGSYLLLKIIKLIFIAFPNDSQIDSINILKLHKC